MSQGPFRYEALLQVFQSKEDQLEQEMAQMERERQVLGGKIQSLLRECEKTRRTLTLEDPPTDTVTFLRYMEGVMVRVQESRREEGVLQKRILDRMGDLRKIRTERMRFTKLKDQHHARVQRFLQRLEQKVSDEFAQRKHTL